jgi:hypothetical protein
MTSLALQYVCEDRRRAIGDLAVTVKAWRSLNEYVHTNNPCYLLERSQGALQDAQKSQGAHTRGLLAEVNGQLPTDSAHKRHTGTDLRDLTTQVNSVALSHRGGVRASGDAHRCQVQACRSSELRQAAIRVLAAHRAAVS